MNADNIKKIREKIEEIEKIDLNKNLIEAYPDDDTSTLILEAGFTANKTISLLRRLLKQFDGILNEEEATVLPMVFTFNEYDSPSGQNNVYGYLEHIIKHISQKNFNEVSKSVRWLIAYQMNFGFWNQSKTKVHDIDALSLKELEDELGILLAQCNELKEKNSNLRLEIEKEKSNLLDLIKTKKEELQTITNTLGKVTNEANEINSFWQNATKLDSEINSIKGSWNESLIELKKQKSDQQDKFNDFSKTNEEEIGKLIKLIHQTEEKEKVFIKQLEFIEGKKSFIEEKEEEIIKLTGFAADGSLGHTFNLRQGNLEKQVRLWFYAIPVMIIICLIWVLGVFYLNDINDIWIGTLVSTIKTIPAFIMLYFVIRQYSKERNLQEEYAFKASVAMTLKAYSDQLGEEGDTEKRKMLLSAIDKLYTSPKINNEASGIFRLRSKSLNDTLKTMLDFLQQNVKR